MTKQGNSHHSPKKNTYKRRALTDTALRQLAPITSHSPGSAEAAQLAPHVLEIFRLDTDTSGDLSIVHCVPRPPREVPDLNRKHIGEWMPRAGGGRVRMIYTPSVERLATLAKGLDPDSPEGREFQDALQMKLFNKARTELLAEKERIERNK